MERANLRRAVGLALLVSVVSTPFLAAQELAGRAKLRAHTQEFRREVVNVTEGVWVAVGFDLANAILLEGPEGLVIVDTGSGVAAAKAMRTAFDAISSKPVRAIVYTPHHPDHVGGASAFAGAGETEIWAHELLLPGERAANVGRAGRDGGNQFGAGLPEALRLNNGIGPAGQIGAGGNGYLAPTKTFAGERTTVRVAGLTMDLVLAPGETDDQIYVWLPDKKVLMPGDNFYRAFPNLYAIRGVPLRRVDWWVDSLTAIIAERAEYLVPSHSRPIAGAAAVAAALTAYRDGVKSVLDQTIAGMADGLRPDELVAKVKLPAALAANPYLQEFYGTVEWSVRAIYTYYLGWFDGNATHLFPLPARDRAARIVALAGGDAAILSQVRDALATQEFQWAAELADYVLDGQPGHLEARRLKAQARTELGERQVSANARNFYLSSAQYLLREPR